MFVENFTIVGSELWLPHHQNYYMKIMYVMFTCGMLMTGPGKRACSGHTHFEIPVIDEELDIPVDTLFQYCFADTPIYRRVLDARRTFGKFAYYCLKIS